MNKNQTQTQLEKEWYIQGINAVPIYILAGPISGIFKCKETLGYNYSNFIMSFEKDYCLYCYNRQDLKHMFSEFMKRHKKDKEYLKWLNNTSEKEKKPMLNYIKNKLQEIPGLSDKGLIEEYIRFTDIFYSCFGASHLVEAIALNTDVMIKDMLLESLKKIGKTDKFTRYFTQLTQPTKKLFFSEFNKSLAEMIDFIKKNKIKDLENSKELNKLINKHLKEFFWIKSQWSVGTDYSKKDIIKEIKELMEKKEKIEVTTDEQLKENINTKKKLFKGLNLSKEIIDLIEITDFGTYWQDDRKIVILSGCWALEKFVNEIAKRFKLNPNNLKYLLPDEITFESMKSIKDSDLEERRKGSMYLYHNNQRVILIGEDYINAKKRLVEQKEERLEEIDGMCASMGKAIGKVKVCLSQAEIPKVEEGDILVTTMTRPEFVPAMRKAAAIVTDEGGITCHAAVISRELKKPCVIATKNATKILNDNDLVEVNANHGWVRVIK